MKTFLENIEIIDTVLNTENIEINKYNDVFGNYYVVDAKVTVFDDIYFISVTFFNDNFDCRVEVIENDLKCNFIEFDHTQDLEETLELAIDKIVDSK